MTLVFFLVRIAVMPPYWANVFATFGTRGFEQLGAGVQVAWITSCIVLDLLNIAWMYKIARGCFKVLRGKLGRKNGRVDPGPAPFGNRADNHTD